MIRQAMQDHDEWVVEFDYVDSKSVRTRRVVSPIRFLASDRFLGLCLSREQPRQFYLDRCDNLRLKRAHEYLMPVPM
jgi:predicted DNA-binding transcriptional regulator YafY